MEIVRWGILGTGRMARELTETIADIPDGEVVAVASRTEQSAAAFAARHGIPRWYGAYQDLVVSGGIDAVYVATTNDQHHPNALVCLQAGLAMLCEKPLALNHPQAVEMVATARGAGVFLMEAMWMRFLPFLDRVEALIGDGAVGEVRYLQADFGYPADEDPERRWLNADLGGGSLADIGIYPFTLAYTLLGEPEVFEAVAVPAPTGVDAQLGVVMRHQGGALSVLSSSFEADTGVEATIAGREGRIRVHAPFHHPSRVTLHRGDRVVAEYDVGYQGSGYGYEVEEVHRCLREGRLESPRMPLDDSLAVMSWLDAIRHRVGFRYPGEQDPRQGPAPGSQLTPSRNP